MRAHAAAVATLPALVESFRCAGVDVRVHVRGDLDATAGHRGLTVYRIVQECADQRGEARATGRL